MSNHLMSRGRLGIAALAAIGMTFGLPAAAQSDEDEEEAGSGSLVEEIVVTATYRDTQLMDTPLTISALTDVDIEQRGVEDIKNLFLAIPGLNYGNATQTWHRVTARGVAQFRAPTGPIAMYVDNTPVQGTGSRSPLLPNFDLERIEVLKGPQGSLYGEGSMVGAIRYITRKASPEGFRLGRPGAGSRTRRSPTTSGTASTPWSISRSGIAWRRASPPTTRYKSGVHRQGRAQNHRGCRFRRETRDTGPNSPSIPPTR